MADIDTETLVARAKAGDASARDELARRAYPDLLRAAAHYIRRRAPGMRRRMETADLAQSAFRDAVRSLSTHDSRGPGSFGRWLRGILQNKARRKLASLLARRRDARRETSLEPGIPLVAGSTPPVDRAILEEQRRMLESAMADLSDRHRHVLRFRYFDELPWKETAGRLGLTEEAAQMLCQRALVQLRRACYQRTRSR